MNNAVEVVNEHYKSIIKKDIDKICNKYINSDETYVILEGPRLTTKSIEKIKTGWVAFCNSPITLESINWIEGPFVDTHETMAWVAGIINLKVKIENKIFENTFRSTFVLIKENENFKIKHEHVSLVHPDPYGIGDWLTKK